MAFGIIIIGDEILSGKRTDKHFSWLAGEMAARGLRLSWVEYLGDDRARLASVFERTRAAGDVGVVKSSQEAAMEQTKESMEKVEDAEIKLTSVWRLSRCC